MPASLVLMSVLHTNMDICLLIYSAKVTLSPKVFIVVVINIIIIKKKHHCKQKEIFVGNLDLNL